MRRARHAGPRCVHPVVTPSLAAPPEPAYDSFVLEDVCGFPIQVEVTGKVKVIEHGDRLITLAPGQRAPLTNEITGETIRINLAGAFHEEVQPNGDLIGKGTGHNVFAGPGVEGLLYTTGNVSYTDSASTGAIEIRAQRGKIAVLCGVLA